MLLFIQGSSQTREPGGQPWGGRKELVQSCQSERGLAAGAPPGKAARQQRSRAGRRQGGEAARRRGNQASRRPGSQAARQPGSQAAWPAQRRAVARWQMQQLELDRTDPRHNPNLCPGLSERGDATAVFRTSTRDFGDSTQG